jgi:thioredoxin reductase (NADPH)
MKNQQKNNKIVKNVIFESRNKYNHEPDRNKIYDVIIVGSGVVGYSSAMYAARLGLKVLIIGEIPGGTLAFTGRVENYPGFVSIEGQELTQLFENHALDYDVDLLIDKVDEITKNKKMFNVNISNVLFKSKSIILATGSKVKKLNINGEEDFFGKGVGYCALCEAAFVNGKNVVVVGGGDSAVKEAILVSEYAKKVYIINNENELHPEEQNAKVLNNKIKENKIEVINNNEILEIVGKDFVEKIILKKNYKNNLELKVDSVFVYIGRIAQSNLVKSLGVKLNKQGEVIVDKNQQTNIQGFFAAGDVTDIDWKQAIIGVAQGVTASYCCYKFCNNLR